MSGKSHVLIELEDVSLIEIFALLSSMRAYFDHTRIHLSFSTPPRHVENEFIGEVDAGGTDGADGADDAGDVEKARASVARLFDKISRRKMSTEEKAEETPKLAESSADASPTPLHERGNVRLLINAKLWEQLKQEAASVGTLTTAELARSKLRVPVARPEAMCAC